MNDNQHREDLGLEHGDVLKVEGDVEEGKEGVDELEEDQLEDDVPGRRLGRFILTSNELRRIKLS